MSETTWKDHLMWLLEDLIKHTPESDQEYLLNRADLLESALERLPE